MTLAIAIDAMGGDHAPREIVRGAVDAAKIHQDAQLLLVGREDDVRRELVLADREGRGPVGNIDVVAAEHAIEMGDSPVEALRRKRGSSIEVATRLVRDGKAAAVVSAGNTGACVAAGTILLGLLPGVRRAGIAACLRAGSSATVVIDVGANVSSKPEHLMQYGVMASLYARGVLGVEDPRVGLLNIGIESEKGNSLVKSTHALFRESRLNFVGNVEGGEVFRGECDVVVCDGFVGNIVLKVSEGLAETMVEAFRSSVRKTLRALPSRTSSMVEVGIGGSSQLHAVESPAEFAETDPAGWVGRKLGGALTSMRETIDYAEYGGAPLLGINGVTIIAHGRSDARAISNAVRFAKRMVEADINRHITEEVQSLVKRP